MVDDIALCVGSDVSKEKIAIGLAQAGRKGEVRYYGEIANRADAVRKLVGKLDGSENLARWLRFRFNGSANCGG